MASTVPLLTKPNPSEERIIEFKGLNRKLHVEEGEMSEMLNLTSDNYPLLCPRKLRGSHTLPYGVARPLSLITKYERIAMIAEKADGSIAFYYDGEEQRSVTGLTEDTEMVSINTKICFFPQKTYLTLVRSSDSVAIGEYKRLDASSSVAYAELTITNTDAKLAMPDGHSFNKGDAVDIKGILDVDSSLVIESEGSKISVCSQSDGSGADIELPVGVKFCAFKRNGSDDFWICAVSKTAFTMYSYRQDDSTLETANSSTLRDDYNVVLVRWSDPVPVPQVPYRTLLAGADMASAAIRMIYGANVDVSCIVEDATSHMLTLPRETFIELTGEGAAYVTFQGTVKREVPDIHHVIEWNNRLWGASDSDNTIYACKLGDPTNWKYYQGTSLDSYYAQQGTDENWTGCAAYSGHLIFFKQNTMTRIYGTSPSSFQVANMVCFGVEQGSSRSVVTINDKVFYKSTIGIMAYEGGTPYNITEKLNMQFRNVVGGTEGIKYYASIERLDGEHELMVLDIDKAIWHKEDSVRFRDCCTLDGRLYFITDTDSGVFKANRMYVINPEEPTEKLYDREWMAVFGPFDEYIENQKIYSKMSLRFVSESRSKVHVYIKMDDGEWELVKKLEFTDTGGEQVLIVPRRCDRFSIKISGKGDCRVKSLTRRYRRGSGVRI